MVKAWKLKRAGLPVLPAAVKVDGLLPQPAGLLELPITCLNPEAAEEWQRLHYQIDLGSDHWLQFLQWGVDFSIPENVARWGAHKELISAHPVVGANVIHRCRTETGWHEGAIHFRTVVTRLWTQKHAEHCWDVKSWSPLTLAPSLLAHCPCKDHGHIVNGRWVKC